MLITTVDDLILKPASSKHPVVQICFLLKSNANILVCEYYCMHVTMETFCIALAFVCNSLIFYFLLLIQFDRQELLYYSILLSEHHLGHRFYRKHSNCFLRILHIVMIIHKNDYSTGCCFLIAKFVSCCINLCITQYGVMTRM